MSIYPPAKPTGPAYLTRSADIAEHHFELPIVDWSLPGAEQELNVRYSADGEPEPKHCLSCGAIADPYGNAPCGH